jgi:uncharacterized phiE125 gp8 family phage protein
MHSALSLVTAPASEPVTLADAKAQLRVDNSGDDTLISGLIIKAHYQLRLWSPMRARSVLAMTSRCVVTH